MNDKEKIIHEFLNCMHQVSPNLNDTFYYAAADIENIYLDGIDDEEGGKTQQEYLVEAYDRWGMSGIQAFIYTMQRNHKHHIIKPLQTPQYWEAVEWLKPMKYEE